MSFSSSTCNLNELFYQALFDNNDAYKGIQRSIYFCIGLILTSFVMNVLSGKYSQVDQAWSIVPFLYSWLVVNDERTMLMAVVATIWGCRLSWNFNRRGGYSFPPWKGEEDYRWSYLRQGFLISWLKNPVIWTIFNFGFICLYQHFLLWLIAAPAIVASLVSSSCGKSPLNWLDYVAALLYLTAVIVETIADNQQFAFQKEKNRRRAAGARLTATQGEQLWNWSGMGWILLCLLFQGSGWFTEAITISKYPKYREYQKSTPLYLPNPLHLFKAKAD